MQFAVTLVMVRSLCFIRFRIWLVLGAGLLTVVPGCAASQLQWSPWTGLEHRVSHDPGSSGRRSNTLLRPVQTPGNAVQLEILAVERPADDPLLRTALWDEVDQIGALPGRVRKALKKHGLRVGVAASTPPEALQKMLGWSREIVNEGRGDSRRRSGWRQTRRPGGQIEVQTGPYHRTLTFDLPWDEKTKRKTLRHVRGVLRVTVRELGDGWAKLEFVPEVHHGRQKARIKPQPEFRSWITSTSQEVERLYDQKFTVTLNLGEMVVLSAAPDKEDSLGRCFFLSRKGKERTQRLVVVRLANVQTDSQ